MKGGKGEKDRGSLPLVFNPLPSSSKTSGGSAKTVFEFFTFFQVLKRDLASSSFETREGYINDPQTSPV